MAQLLSPAQGPWPTASGPPGQRGQVVLDAGAAIRLKRLERFGGELLTTSGVYAEVDGPAACRWAEAKAQLFKPGLLTFWFSSFGPFLVEVLKG